MKNKIEHESASRYFLFLNYFYFTSFGRNVLKLYMMRKRKKRESI
jgi:hypothetical protein